MGKVIAAEAEFRSVAELSDANVALRRFYKDLKKVLNETRLSITANFCGVRADTSFTDNTLQFCLYTSREKDIIFREDFVFDAKTYTVFCAGQKKAWGLTQKEDCLGEVGSMVMAALSDYDQRQLDAQMQRFTTATSDRKPEV